MSSKVGRPKVNNPKNVEVKIRLDNITNNELLEYCKKNNITRTEAIRMGIDLLLKKK